MAVIEYVEDDDPETGPGGEQGAKRAAFKLDESVPSKLVWRGLKDPGPIYRPYVIRAEFQGAKDIDESRFQFRFLKASGTFGRTIHVVDLNDQRIVWRDLPSTLRGISSDAPCAFLFLTAELKTRRPDLYADGDVHAHEVVASAVAVDDNGTGGNGKWPRGAGQFIVGKEQVKALVARAKDGKLTDADVALLMALGAP